MQYHPIPCNTIQYHAMQCCLGWWTSSVLSVLSHLPLITFDRCFGIFSLCQPLLLLIADIIWSWRQQQWYQACWYHFQLMTMLTMLISTMKEVTLMWADRDQRKARGSEWGPAPASWSSVTTSMPNNKRFFPASTLASASKSTPTSLFLHQCQIQYQQCGQPSAPVSQVSNHCLNQI